MRVSVSPSVHAKMWTQRVVWLLVGTIVALAGLSGSVRAQVGNGTINGTVTDPKGLPIEGASVSIKNTDTGAETPVMTNEVGRYVVPLLQPGHYEVTVSKDGFATVVNKDINLIVGQTLTIDVPMQLATQQGTITVTAATPLIEAEKTEQSQALNENLVNGLPLGGRRWEDFVLLTPGVTNDGGSGLQSFHGISGLYNNNTVDGANNNQAFFSESRGRAIIVSYVYSQDSIKEFQVSSSNYSAEFGQAAGGTVNAVTKSGTNQLHGDLFYDLRYPSLNALDPVGNAQGTKTQSVHQQNHFGGSAGGPLIKDKLFLFATYDGFRKVNPIIYTSSVNGTAFSNLTCPAAITTTQCTAAKSFITTDLLGAFARNLKQDVAFGKLDYQLNQANHLSLAFNWANWGEPYGYNTNPTVNNGGATQNGVGGTHNRFLIANWNTTISSNKLNEFRFQWGRDFEFDGTNSPGPSVSLSSFFSYGETLALPRPAFPDEHRYQASDSFSYIRGAHAFKLGVDVNFIHELLINLFTGDGTYSYFAGSTQQIFSNWVADVYGANLGDGLTGKHWNSFSQVTDPITGVGKDDFYNNDYAGFVQDTWKARPNLTVNIGLRYDVQDVPRPPKPNTLFPIFSQYTSTLNIDKNNFAPRLGIAWSLNPKTVFRASYGIFYAKTSNSTYYALRVENGVYQQLFSCNSGPTSSGTCNLTFPNVLYTPPGPPLAAPFTGALTPTAVGPTLTSGTVCGGQAALIQTCEIHGMTPDFVNPTVHEMNLTFERQLPGNMSLSASYLLTRALHLPTVYDANLAPTNQTVTYDVLASSSNPTPLFSYTVPYYVCNGASAYPAQAACTSGRFAPQTGIILNTASVLNSWYNGMILTLRKPMSHGVEVLVNYTLSRAMDNGQVSGTNGTFYGSDGVLDPYNLRGDYAHSDLDQRNRFVGTFIWAPPYAHSLSNGAERQVLDGWSFSGIVTAVNGQPFTASIRSSTPPAAQNFGVDGGVTGGSVSPYSGVSGSRVPWLPRNSFNLPGFAVMDFRAQKDIVFRERFHLQLRADAFNLFNSPIVSAVNTGYYTFGSFGSGASAVTCPAGHVGTNPCLVPVTSPVFKAPSTTSTIIGGPRQLQFGARFEF